MGPERHGTRSSCRTARAPVRRPLEALQRLVFLPVSPGRCSPLSQQLNPMRSPTPTASQPWDRGRNQVWDQGREAGASAGSRDASSSGLRARDPTTHQSAGVPHPGGGPSLRGSRAPSRAWAAVGAARLQRRVRAAGRAFPTERAAPARAGRERGQHSAFGLQGGAAAGTSCPSVVRRVSS